MSEKCGVCGVAGIFRRVELASHPCPINLTSCSLPMQCLTEMLFFQRLWLLQRKLTGGQEVLPHALQKPWCAVAVTIPCVSCLSQEAHVLSAGRQVLKIMHYTRTL